MTLKPEIKSKWITALRSGEYKQGTRALYNKSNNTFCCLGVLCHVNGATMSNASCYALGVSDTEQHALWILNDFDDATFPQIADYIEGMK